jgi:hypothetical protein
MKQLLIVVCTKAKTDSDFARRPIYPSLQKHIANNSSISSYIFKNNELGLSECYNKILTNPSYLGWTVLFVHDDVILEDLFLYEKLISSPYTITGLAGTKSFDKKAEHLAWHLAGNPRDFVGEVAHKHEGQTFTTKFGPTDSRALIIDGLFISCKVTELVENELYFDEAFGFHFYDICFCLAANEKKVTCGVLPIRAIHYGLGDSMLATSWKVANVKFKQTYCL